MPPTIPVKLLERYRVDRATGGTADGSTQLVVLVLKAVDSQEIAVAMSAVDAMMIATRLTQAAAEAKGH